MGLKCKRCGATIYSTQDGFNHQQVCDKSVDKKPMQPAQENVNSESCVKTLSIKYSEEDSAENKEKYLGRKSNQKPLGTV